MRTTVTFFQKQKAKGIPITMLTAYDATSARLAEQAGIQTLLVGDSLGMVVQGKENTLHVTLENMLYHARLVAQNTTKPFIIGDMPFLTYNISPEQALENAGRFLMEAGVQSVKLEGGTHIAPTIERLVQAGIPVLAHIGLTPQSVHRLGGWRVQGKTQDEAARLLDDAEAVQAAGAYAVVLELMPAELATMVTEKLKIPTIGIGAGVGCSGQVQVFHDILGLLDYSPKHSRQYLNVRAMMLDAIMQYQQDVEAGSFPAPENGFNLDETVLDQLYSTVKP